MTMQTNHPIPQNNNKKRNTLPNISDKRAFSIECCETKRNEYYQNENECDRLLPFGKLWISRRRDREKRSAERDEPHTNGTMPEMAEKGFGLI